MSRGKNKSLSFVSSDEDEVVIFVAHTSASSTESESTNEVTPRSSQRLRRKSERSNFVLPSRNKIWDAIPSESPDKRTSKISPKRTVNNFTRVYNSYNYDDYDVSSHDGSDGFIDDSSESDVSSNEQQDKRRGRIKNFRRRIKSCPSSDEEEGLKSNTLLTTVDSAKICGNVTEFGEAQVQKRISPCGTNFDSGDHSNSDSDNSVIPIKRPRNMSVLELNSESSSCSDTHEREIQSTAITIVDSVHSDHPDAVFEGALSAVRAGENSSEANNFAVAGVTVISSEDNSSISNSSTENEDSGSLSETEDRTVKFRRKKEKLFQKFKDAQKLRKASSQISSHS